jgi:hypothetical protein
MSRLTPQSIRASQAELPPIGTVITELRRQVPYIQQEQHRYRSLRGFQDWANHPAYAALIEAGAEVMNELADPIGFWAAAISPGHGSSRPCLASWHRSWRRPSAAHPRPGSMTSCRRCCPASG